MDRIKWPHILLLTALCFIVYSNSLKGGFHYDDFHVLNEVNTSFSLSNLRFFSWLTFYANALPESPGAVYYHLTNLLIHLCMVIAVYFTVFFLIEKEETGLPLYTSILFLVHPLATEPVNYITARFTQLAALSGLLALMFFILYIKKRKFPYLIPVVIFFITGTFSKEVGIFYAAAGIFIYSVYFLDLKTLLNKRNIMIVSGIILLILIFLFGFTGAFARFKSPHFLKYFLIQNRVFLLKYIRLMIMPVGLSIEHRAMTLMDFRFDAGLLLSIAVNMAAVIYAVVIRNRNKLISFSIMWIYLFHVPYFFLTSGETAVEYRTYPMLFGYALLVACCLWVCIKKRLHRRIIIITVVILFGILTALRNSEWRDDFTLWAKVLEGNPDSRRALNESGKACFRRGLYDRAIAGYNRAIELEPANYEAYNNRGNAYKKKGMIDRAIADYTSAIELNAKYFEAHNNRGIAFGRKKLYDRAVADLSEAVRLKPGNARIYYNRGLTYKNLRLYDKAMADFNRVIELSPGDKGAYFNRGFIYGGKGDYGRAAADFTRALELDPGYIQAYKYRSIAYRKLGRQELAEEDEKKAKTLSSG